MTEAILTIPPGGSVDLNSLPPSYEQVVAENRIFAVPDGAIPDVVKPESKSAMPFSVEFSGSLEGQSSDTVASAPPMPDVVVQVDENAPMPVQELAPIAPLKPCNQRVPGQRRQTCLTAWSRCGNALADCVCNGCAGLANSFTCLGETINDCCGTLKSVVGSCCSGCFACLQCTCEGIGKGLGSICECCCQDAKSCALTIFWLLITGVNAFFIWAGAQAHNNRDVNCTYDIPMWLIVSGVTQIIAVSLTSVRACCGEGVQEKASLGGLVKLFALFLTIWLIVGTVFVFSPGGIVCDYTAYKTAQVFIIFQWSLSGILCCFKCCRTIGENL